MREKCPADCVDGRRKGVPQIAQMNVERKLSEDQRETNSLRNKNLRKSVISAGNKPCQIAQVNAERKLSEDQRDQRETNSFRKNTQ